MFKGILGVMSGYFVETLRMLLQTKLGKKESSELALTKGR